MRLPFGPRALLGAALLGLAGSFAQAQPCQPPPPYCPPGYIQTVPGSTDQQRQSPPQGSGALSEPGAMASAPMTPTTPEAPSLGDIGAGAGLGATTAVGYIDSAIPQSMFRLRFDSAYDDNRPDRAEFFYPKCGCFTTAPAPFTDPKAPGPKLPESRVDYQELTSYLEIAPSERFSVFGEIPVRFINPTDNPNRKGLGDINFGFKYAFLYSEQTVATLQMRFMAPTGDPFAGLGTDHWTVEPAFLLYRRLNQRWFLEAEFRDYIPFASEDDFAGNILRYGVGVSYLALDTCNFRVQPVVETVGWTCLTGKEITDGGIPVSASGDTIVNLKLGARFGFGRSTEPGMLSRSDLYVGYGRALTGDVWYKDIVRAEFRLRF